MGLDADLIAAIDARIAAASERWTAFGTVASITDVNDAYVTFDGSSVAVPVKLAGDTDFAEGDRVLLIKTGSRAAGTREWWTATVPLTRRWAPAAGVLTTQSSGTTTSSSFTDLPTTADITFTKRWADTRVLAMLGTTGSFATGTGTEAAFGLRFTDSGGTVTDHEIVNVPYSADSVRMPGAAWDYLSGLTADVWTVRAVWRRRFGSGTPAVDAFVRISVNVMEVSP